MLLLLISLQPWCGRQQPSTTAATKHVTQPAGTIDQSDTPMLSEVTMMWHCQCCQFWAGQPVTFGSALRALLNGMHKRCFCNLLHACSIRSIMVQFSCQGRSGVHHPDGPSSSTCTAVVVFEGIPACGTRAIRIDCIHTTSRSKLQSCMC